MWLLAAVAALLAAPAPAAAQAKKPTKGAPKVEEKPAPKPEPKPKKKPEPEPEPEPEPKPLDDGKLEKPATHDKGRVGVALQLGLPLSRSNAEKKITPLPLSGGLTGLIDVHLDQKVYLRVEPGLTLLRRNSTVRVVHKVDASNAPTKTTIVTEDISNKVLSIDLSVRLLLGYDYTRLDPKTVLTGRAGALVGFNSAKTGARPTEPETCSTSSRSSGAVYGLHLAPIAARFIGESKSFEVGLTTELRSQKIPRCDVPLSGEFTVNPGEVATFTPKIIDSQLTVVVVGLQGALLF